MTEALKSITGNHNSINFFKSLINYLEYAVHKLHLFDVIYTVFRLYYLSFIFYYYV